MKHHHPHGHLGLTDDEHRRHHHHRHHSHDDLIAEGHHGPHGAHHWGDPRGNFLPKHRDYDYSHDGHVDIRKRAYLKKVVP